jgi:hypothetical protein
MTEVAREALESMCIQFAFNTTHENAPALTTGGLSALEEAFAALGWSDPHPIEWDKCDEPGCSKRTSCGFPTPNGYRRTCGEHSQIGKPSTAQGEL